MKVTLSQEAKRIVGDRIASARSKAGHTQTSLGKLLGIHHGTLSLLECGKRLPAYETILALCEALHIPADYFYKGVK